MDSVNFDVTGLVVKPAVVPAGARNTATVGSAIDTQLRPGVYAKSVHFVVTFGTITDGSYAVTVEESDASGSGYAAVPAARVFSNPGSVPATADDTAVQFSAKIDKRYCRITVTPTGATTGAVYAGVAVLREI